MHVLPSHRSHHTHDNAGRPAHSQDDDDDNFILFGPHNKGGYLSPFPLRYCLSPPHLHQPILTHLTTHQTPNPPPSSSSRVPPRPSSTSPARQTSSPAKTTAPAPSKTTGVINGPSHWACPVPLYYQCGGYFDGKPWTGCTKCASGATCLVQNGEFTLSVARIAIWGSAELEGK